MKSKTLLIGAMCFSMGLGLTSAVAMASQKTVQALVETAHVMFNGANSVTTTSLVVKGQTYVKVQAVEQSLHKAGYAATWRQNTLAMGVIAKKTPTQPKNPSVDITDISPVTSDEGDSTSSDSSDTIVRSFQDMFGKTDGSGFQVRADIQGAHTKETYNIGGQYHWLDGVIVPDSSFSPQSTSDVYTNLAKLTITGNNGVVLFQNNNISSSIGKPIPVHVDVSGQQSITVDLEGQDNTQMWNSTVGFVNVKLTK